MQTFVSPINYDNHIAAVLPLNWRD